MSFLRKLPLLALGLVAGVILLEVGLWATGAAVASRARGELAGGDEAFTILCVGDSWTQGAPDGRFPDFLVDRLEARSERVRFRAVNVGRAGTNSSQALARLPREIERYRPQLLLLLTGNNDHHNLTASNYWEFQDERLGWSSTLAARARISLHSLRVYRLTRATWRRLSGGATANEFFVRSPDTPADGPARLAAIEPATHRRQLEYNLTRFVETARRERIPIVFQTYFHFHGFRVNEIIRDVAWRHDVPLVDHNRIFHERVPAARRAGLRIPDGHPNPAGYAMMAEAIAELLEERELLP